MEIAVFNMRIDYKFNSNNKIPKCLAAIVFILAGMSVNTLMYFPLCFLGVYLMGVEISFKLGPEPSPEEQKKF